MFRISGSLNESVYHQINTSTIPFKAHLWWGGFLLCLKSSIENFNLKHTALAIVLLLFAVLFIVIGFLRSCVVGSRTRSNVRKMEEITGSTEVIYTTDFYDDAIAITLNTTDMGFTYPYESLVKFRKTRPAFLLFTDHHQCIPVLREKMDKKQEAAFLKFLKSKPTKIRW